MKTLEYYPKGTLVYYFSGYTFNLIESVVKDIHISFSGKEGPVIVYTVDGKDHTDLKLRSELVHEDKEKLKELVLSNFKEVDEEVITS